MATAPEELAGQVAAYQRMVAAVRQAVLAFVARSWEGLEDWRDDDIDRWVVAILPVVAAGRAQVAALTDAHLANLIGAITDSPPRPVGVDPEDVTVEALRGVPAAQVYRRAGETVWSELSRGVDLADATARGLTRATAITETDLQLAKTHTSRRVLSSDKRVVGYRRVLNGPSCKLCVVASTQLYRTDELMGFHKRCDCGTAPVIGDRDPGRVLNRDLLARLKKAGVSSELSLEQAATRARKALRRAEEAGDVAKRAAETRRLQHAQRQLEEFRGEHGTIRTVTVRQDGEIGPVLTDAEHAFTRL